MNTEEKIAEAAPRSGFEFAEKVVAAHLAKGDVVETLLRYAQNDECDFLELKASVHVTPESLNKNEKPSDIFWNIAHELIAMINSHGGILLIGVSDKGDHEAVPLQWHKTGELVSESDLDRYIRDDIAGRITPKNRSWKYKEEELSIDVELDSHLNLRKIKYQGHTVLAFLVKPLEGQEILVQPSININGRLIKEAERLPYRKCGMIGQCNDHDARADQDHYHANRKVSSPIIGEWYAQIHAEQHAQTDAAELDRQILAYRDKLVQDALKTKVGLFVDLDAEGREQDDIPDDFATFNDADSVPSAFDDELSEDDLQGDEFAENDDDDDDDTTHQRQEPSSDSLAYTTIRRNLLDLLNDETRLALIGEPGAGKTLSLQCFALRRMKACKGSPALHLYIPLGQWSNEKGGSVEALAEYYSRIPWSFLERLISDNRLHLILDALNECPDELKPGAIHAIAAFCGRYPTVPVVISARTNEDVRTFALPTYSVRPMNEDQQLDFLSKYLKDSSCAKALLDRIHAQPGGETIAANPMLLRMVSEVVNDSPNSELPNGRAELYRKWITRWYGRESAKARKAKKHLALESPDSAIELLSRIAFLGRLKGYRDIPLDIIKAEFPDINARDPLFEGPILTIQDGLLHFRHETFQEYLCAESLLKHPDALNDLPTISYETWGMPLAYAFELSHDQPFPRELTNCATTCSRWFGWLLDGAGSTPPICDATGNMPSGQKLLAQMTSNWYEKDTPPLRYILATSSECHKRWLKFEIAVLDNFNTLKGKKKKRAFTILYFKNLLALKLKDLRCSPLTTDILFDYIKRRYELANFLLNSGFATLDELPECIKNGLKGFKFSNFSTSQIISFWQTGIISEDEFQSHVNRLTADPTIETAATLVKANILKREYFTRNLVQWKAEALTEHQKAISLIRGNFYSSTELLKEFTDSHKEPSFSWLVKLLSNGCIELDTFLAWLKVPEALETFNLNELSALGVLQMIPNATITQRINDLASNAPAPKLIKAINSGLLSPYIALNRILNAHHKSDCVHQIAIASGLSSERCIQSGIPVLKALGNSDADPLIAAIQHNLSCISPGDNSNSFLVCSKHNRKRAKAISLDGSIKCTCSKVRKEMLVGDVWQGELSPHKTRFRFTPHTLVSRSAWDGRSVFITHARVVSYPRNGVVFFSAPGTTAKFCWRHPMAKLWQLTTSSEWTLETKIEYDHKQKKAFYVVIRARPFHSDDDKLFDANTFGESETAEQAQSIKQPTTEPVNTPPTPKPSVKAPFSTNQLDTESAREGIAQVLQSQTFTGRCISVIGNYGFLSVPEFPENLFMHGSVADGQPLIIGQTWKVTVGLREDEKKNRWCYSVQTATMVSANEAKMPVKEGTVPVEEEKAPVSIPLSTTLPPNASHLSIYVDETWPGTQDPQYRDIGVIGGIVVPWTGTNGKLPTIRTHLGTEAAESAMRTMLEKREVMPFVFPIKLQGNATSRYFELVQHAILLLLGWIVPRPNTSCAVDIYLEHICDFGDGHTETDFFKTLTAAMDLLSSDPRFSKFSIRKVQWTPKDFAYVPYGDLVCKTCVPRPEQQELARTVKVNDWPGYVPFTPSLFTTLQSMDNASPAGYADLLINFAKVCHGTSLFRHVFTDAVDRAKKSQSVLQAILEKIESCYASEDRDIELLNRITNSFVEKFNVAELREHPRGLMLRIIIGLQHANHNGDPDLANGLVKEYLSVRERFIQVDRTFCAEIDANLIVHLHDLFDFDKALVLSNTWIDDPLFPALPKNLKGKLFSSHAQTLAMLNRPKEANELFERALTEFAGEPSLFASDIVKTGSYHATNLLELNPARALVKVENIIGGTLKETAADPKRLDGSSFHEYLFLKSIWRHRNIVHDVIRIYCNNSASWAATRDQHPYELILFYRTLMLNETQPNRAMTTATALTALFDRMEYGGVIGLIRSYMRVVFKRIGFNTATDAQFKEELDTVAIYLPAAADRIASLREAWNDSHIDISKVLPFNYI